MNCGGTPLEELKYVNKRAEMWGLMKEWLGEKPVQIPDDNRLETDLCGLRYNYDSKSRLKLESKEDAKKRGIKSPDDGDALALTFAFPVARPAVSAGGYRAPKSTVPGFGGRG